jgi:fatty acid-binding protein DegV
MSVVVITDSAAALPEELAAEIGAVVVPMWVMLGGTAYREGELAASRPRARPPVSFGKPLRRAWARTEP